MSLQQSVINTLIVSMPEEFFITMIVLILLGRYDYISKEIWKCNLFKVMIVSVIPLSIIFNLLKYCLPNHSNILVVINILLLSISISILYRIKNKKEYFKVLMFTALGFLIFMITQLITIFMVMYILKMSPNSFNQSAIINFIIVLPERVLQYLMLSLIFLKQNGLTKVNLSKIILENSVLRFFTILFTVGDIAILMWMAKYIVFDKILEQIPLDGQIAISVGIMILVIISLLSIWVIPMCIYPVEKYKQKYKM